MSDAFIGTIIHIDKQFLPVFPEGCGVNGISVVLRGNVTLVGSNETHRLIMRTMAVFQLVNRGSGSLPQQLIAHANATNRFAGSADLLANYVYSFLTCVRIARPISQKQAVKIHVGIIIIPRNADYFHPSINQTTDDIGLHSAVNEYHFLSCSLLISDDFLTRNFRNKVHSLIISLRHFIRNVVKNNASLHDSMFTKHFG